MAFNLFKKNLPSYEDNKNSKFKNIKKEPEMELTEEELEHVGGNYNPEAFNKMMEIGRELKEEEIEKFSRK